MGMLNFFNSMFSSLLDFFKFVFLFELKLVIHD